jgi:hypothetical protein
LSKPLSLLAFDPGGTTGWARVWVPAAALLPGGSILASIEFEVGQIVGDDKEQGRKIALMLAGPGFSGPLVIESFRLRQFRQDDDLLAPVRMIARIEQIVEILEYWGPVDKVPAAYPIFKQEPSLAKSTCPDNRMRKWGVWTPGRPHANDAMRHAITFLRRAKSDARLRAAAFSVA